ncbi:MAG: MtrB/PioB family decaheme-associated outer membrane protein [Gammaproteobacteria bacterium]|nr:MtrB/PioB family decaheme-associated outer membrane protein [Gammaproteobacteria bacterium]
MKTPTKSMLLIVLLGVAPCATAADNNAPELTLPVDTFKWKCKFCTFEEGHSGYAEGGIGHVDDDSFKFGEYTGLNEDGAYFIGDAHYRYRGTEAHYFDLDARNLGLDSRSVEVEGGRQGKYDLFLNYDEIPHFISDSAVTPFIGTGEDVLNLPPGWVRAPTTTGMTALPGSLRQVDIETQRERLGLGIRFIPARKWQSSINARHETKEGTQRIAGAFQFDATQFLQPVDYTTDEFDASATYTGHRLQARFAYYGSQFKNSDESLTFDNPFTSLFGADAGQLALPPDNDFHQLLTSVGYEINKKTRLTADLAVGRGEQDENFLAPTVNPAIVVPTLPRGSLDGRVDTTNANIRINSALTDRWQFNAALRHDDRDNKTPQATYAWVNTDSVLAALRTNLPYSFTTDELNLSADYHLAKRTRVSVGFDHEETERTFQEVEETEDRTLWTKISSQAQDNFSLLMKAELSDRSISNYMAVPEIFPPQNPLMRIYNMADRERVMFGMQVMATPRETVSIGAGVEHAKNDYDRSVIGLLSSDELSVNLDASMQLSEKTSLYVFWNRQQISSKQAGSSTFFSTPNWLQDEDDTFNATGIGFRHTIVKNKIDIGADYAYVRSRGEITVSTVVPDPSFPDLETRLNSLKVYVDYRLKENLSLKGTVWYEDYDTDDWQLDGVQPDTIPNVLTLGETSPSYDLYVVGLSIRYRFNTTMQK